MKSNRTDTEWLTFNRFRLNKLTGELRMGDEARHLQAQPTRVLLLLASRAGEVVHRDEIRQALWDSETHVDFEQGINWCIKRIREELGDEAKSPRFIETVPRIGYRFIPQCRAVQTLPTPLRRGLMIAAVLVVVLMLSIWQRHQERTLLVLPIDNFTGRPEADALAEARTDMLIASLGSEAPALLRVIDRPTAAKFKGTKECIIKIGRRLHADYVFVGSIASFPDGQRLSGGIFRVSDNTQVWTTSAVGIDANSEKALNQLKDSLAAAVLRK